MSGRGPSFALTALILALLVTACGGGSSGGGNSGSGERIAVVAFSHEDRSDTFRDQRLRLDLTATPRRASISDRAVAVFTGEQLKTPVPGALIRGGDHGLVGDRTVLWFDPTRTQAHVDRFPKKKALDEIPMDRPFGFGEQKRYRVIVSGPLAGHPLTDRSRRPIVKGYEAEFTTGSEYTPEDTPPEFIGAGGNGELAFAPSRAADGLVEFDAQILIEFSEALHPAAMELGSTVFVRNLDVLDHLDRPITIPGTFTPSTDGRTWSFDPSFHYGTGPYTIEVELTTGIRDRAGNALPRAVTRTFVTRENPAVDTVHSLVEDFDTNLYEDGPPTTADWNSTQAGTLKGGAITTTIAIVKYTPVQGTSTALLVDFPLVSSVVSGACPNAWTTGARVMMSFTAADIGTSGAITRIFWSPDQNALFAATHDNMKIRIGHGKADSMSKKFDENWVDGQAPNPAFNGEYKIPQDADVNLAPGTITSVSNFWAWPKLTTPFEYDGTSTLLVDFAVDAALDCQTLRAWFHGTGPVGVGYPGIRALVGDRKDASAHFEQDTNYPNGYPMVFDTAFEIRRKRTFAQSRFYDTAQPSPDFANPVLSPSVQAGGAEYVLEWQGAPGMPDPVVPGKTIANEAAATAWSTDIDVADGSRFIRFRVELIANLNSETVPEFRRIEMPFSFRKE